MPLRIVKLGGSLLDLPDLIPRLRSFLASETPACTVLVVGGGAMADALRDAHARHGLAEVTAHWLCIRAMAIQAEMMLALLPEAQPVSGVSEIQSRSTDTALLVIDPYRFMREEEPRLAVRSLPETWEVTSDSIAARLAELTGADELILLKSAAAPSENSQVLAAEGYVDQFFPQAAAPLRNVRFVNLREERR